MHNITILICGYCSVFLWLTNKTSLLEKDCRQTSVDLSKECWFGNAQNGVGYENNDFLYSNYITLVKIFYSR